MLLNVSSAEDVLLTTYGKLQPPLGKHRLKVLFCSHLYDLSSNYNVSLSAMFYNLKFEFVSFS